MKIRYLQDKERGITRALWEEIFQDDTKEFLDYYYQYKTADNEIIVLEEDSAIRSMVQLNPYQMVMGEQTVHTNYIVGVATDKNYRHRGYMRMLLEKMMEDMYERKEPFTFLMPAAEAIYKPFDFQFIYNQNKGYSGEKAAAKGAFTCKELTEDLVPELAAFSMKVLNDQYNVFAFRDEHYYMTLLHEQKSENGNVILIYKEAELTGYFFYAEEDHIEVREPVISPEYADELFSIINHYFKSSNKEIKCTGVPDTCAGFLEKEEQTPMIMARIIHLQEFMKNIRSEKKTELILNIEDKFIPGNNGTFRFLFNQNGCVIEEWPEGKSVEIIPIARLTGFLFGYLQAADVFAFETTRTTEDIHLFSKVFLNEIV